MEATYYVRTTDQNRREQRSADYADLGGARCGARVLRGDPSLVRVDICQTGSGRIVAAWDRSGEKWLRTI